MINNKSDLNFAQLKQFVSILHEAIIVIDQQQHICLFNADAENLFGYSESEIVNQPIDKIIPPEFRSQYTTLAQQLMQARQQKKMLGKRHKVWGMRKDNTQFPVKISFSQLAINNNTLVIAVVHDETTEDQHQKRIRYSAEHDLLTGLCNRTFLIEALDALLSKNKQNLHLAIFFIDLNQFKPINENYGHIVGDKLLSIAAKRISTNMRVNDIICRFGGDEFVLLVPHYLTKKQLENIAYKIINALNAKINIESKNLYISASIGIARYPENGKTTKELLDAADFAMYKAKKNKAAYCLA